jgi:hypothetical protein
MTDEDFFDPQVLRDILLRLAREYGSSRILAGRLFVSHDQLRAWMRGEEIPPPDTVTLILNLLDALPNRPL